MTTTTTGCHVRALLDELSRKAHDMRPAGRAYSPKMACLVKCNHAVWTSGVVPEAGQGRRRVLQRVAALRMAHLIQFGRKLEAPAPGTATPADPEIAGAAREELAGAARGLEGRVEQASLDALVDEIARVPVHPAELLLVHRDVVPRTYWSRQLGAALRGHAAPLRNPGGYWGFSAFDVDAGGAGTPVASDPWKKSLLAWSYIADLSHAAAAGAPASEPRRAAPLPNAPDAALPTTSLGITADEQALSADALEALVSATPEYVRIQTALAGRSPSAEDRASMDTVNQILRKARTRTTAPRDRAYFLQWLIVLLRTVPTGSSAGSGGGVGYSVDLDMEMRRRIVREIEEYKGTDVVDPWATDATDVTPIETGLVNPWADEEENLTHDPRRVWTPRLGSDGRTYYRVDRSDLRFIVVHIKIRLRPVPRAQVQGAPADWNAITNWYVQRVWESEDIIEKRISGNGYYLNVEFVPLSAPRANDIFAVDIMPGFWPVSSNFADAPTVLAHETHHLLNLDDRYDRLENHATNVTMSTKDRLYWFLVEMDKEHTARDAFSIMTDEHDPRSVLMAEDICAVAFRRSERDACLQVRLQMEVDRGAGFPPLPPRTYVHP